MDPLQILARLEDETAIPPTDAELTSAFNSLKDALDAATGPDADASDEAVQLAADLAAARDKIAAKITEREAAVAANRERLAALRGEDPEPETPDEPEDEPVEEIEDVAEPVAAAADLVKRLTTTLKTRVAEAPAPRGNGITVKTVGHARAAELTDESDFRALGEVFSEFGRETSGKAPIVRVTRNYPEERRLGNNFETNARKIADALGVGQATRAPIAASGGICGPGDVTFDTPICSQRGRVVTPGLPQFGASRGKVTVSPSISIGDLAGNVSVWTSANDANPTNPTTKPCPPLDCPEELQESVDAIVECVTVGNFQAKFSPEWWAANLEVLGAAHDRLAEQTALHQIYTASSSVGTVNEGSTLWNLIQLVRNTVSADRSARRNWDGRYTFIGDAYGRDQIKNQLVVNLGSGVPLRESMEIADATIDGWLRDAGVDNIIWTYDGTYNGSSHRVLAAPGAQTGHLPPTDFGVHIFPEEAFLFLDGGTLDLGTEITDSTLNATNDRQAFAETFEKVLFRGCGAFRGVVTIDASCGCGLTSV